MGAAARPVPDGDDVRGRGLRVALLGWARLALRSHEGGGYNLVVSDLASELVRRGHPVWYLRSGMEYSDNPGIRIEASESWRGVSCFELVNSPNLATGNCNFYNVREQIASPRLCDAVVDWLARIGPDIVHVHSLEGYSFDLPRAIRDRVPGRPRVLITPHNYFYVCSQVDLLHREREACADYEGGRKCDGCLSVPDHESERARRVRLGRVRAVLGRRVFEAAKPLGKRLADVLGTTRRSALPARASELPEACPDDLEEPAHERLVRSRDVHLEVLNEFGERRRAGVAALAAADLVLTPGVYLKQVHEAMGVPVGKLRHVRLAQPHFDLLRESTVRSPGYDRPPWTPALPRPLRLTYFGNCWVTKGLHVLARAVPLLPDDVAGRVEVRVHASGDDRAYRNVLRGFPQVTFHGAYDPAELVSILAETDAGIFAGIALENSPLVVLEMLHAGRFVIASRRGAVLDFVRDGENGLMFAAGDPAGLARAISRVVRGEVPLPAPRRIHEASPLRRFADYMDEMTRIYAEAAGTPRAEAVIEAKPLTAPAARP